MINLPPIKKIQNRIANIMVDASILRGQPAGTVKVVRNFFKELDLNCFKYIKDEKSYIDILNKQTDFLKDKMPSQSWGMARKVLNILIFQAAHDIFLSKEYNLNDLIPFFEIPLDNPNGKRLAEKEGGNLWGKNTTITNLLKENSDTLQKIAKRIAENEHSCEKCYLDLFYFREESDDD